MHCCHSQLASGWGNENKAGEDNNSFRASKSLSLVRFSIRAKVLEVNAESFGEKKLRNYTDTTKYGLLRYNLQRERESRKSGGTKRSTLKAVQALDLFIVSNNLGENK